MAVIKCKMCGGDLVIEPGSTVAECEFCGSKQTIPNQDDDKKLTLFARANRLRMGSEFDKAAGIYESIVADFPEEAEAYWGLVLCKYGIEYVDDPASGRKIPTCHRSSFDSVMDDKDFEQACENADGAARRVYRDEAKAIEEIRKGIIEISGKEEPYDIFICYKETAENGDRTIDSVIAQDVYDALTAKGYRVFFSRITLEDKLGQEYEPYIFAALNSAKIMLAFGTDYEYYNAVWVKNEWSRYLKLMAKDKSKHLIPCYKNIDAYDMPKEFAKLQAQDMGKIGAMQDLLRGIEKILPKETVSAAPVVQERVIVQSTGGPSVDALLSRGYMALEDRAFKEASGYFNDVLNNDPKCAQAYLGLFMADIKARNQIHASEIFIAGNCTNNRYYQRCTQFADTALQAELTDWEQKRQNRLNTEAEEARRKQEKAEKARLRNQEKIPYLAKVRAELAKCSNIVVATDNRTLGLKSDGTVVAVGNNRKGQCNVGDWKDIVAISAGKDHTVGLKANGTVVAVGETPDRNTFANWVGVTTVFTGEESTIIGIKSNGNLGGTYRYSGLIVDDGRCNVSDWTDIVSISNVGKHTLGLKSDGTIAIAGKEKKSYHLDEVSKWTGVAALATSGLSEKIIGLKSDGTVVAAGYFSVYSDEKCDFSNWKEIVEVCAGFDFAVGLKSDGTVVATGKNKEGRCNVSDWTDIVAVSIGDGHTVGLKADGTVVAAGSNYYGQCNVSGWTDVVAVCAAYGRTVGLKSDGTVLATGYNEYGQCDVSDWKLCDDSLHFEEERKVLQLEAERVVLYEKLQENDARIASYKADMEALHGLFSKGRRNQLQAQIEQLESGKAKIAKQIEEMENRIDEAATYLTESETDESSAEE